MRLDIFECRSGGRVKLLESLSKSVNLGFDVFRRGRVSPENLQLLASVMRDFARKMEEYRITLYRVVATSAVREAFNRDLVINRIFSESGLEVEILEPQEETRVSFLAMRDDLRRVMDFDVKTGIFLVVGTGSLLVSCFEKGVMKFSEEVAIGTSRMFDAFGRASESLEQTVENLRSVDLPRRICESVGIHADQPVTLTGMGASVRMLVFGEEKNSDDERHIVLSTGEAVGRAEQALTAVASGRAGAADASKPLAAEISASKAACAAIIEYFMSEFNCVEFISPGVTTRRALAMELVRQNDSHKDPFARDILAICDAIGHKYGYDPAHAASVAELSHKLLTRLRRDFDFPANSDILLDCAARLHDIGRFLDARRHHLHSYYIISNLSLPGVSRREQQIIAAIARYHRHELPSELQPEYLSMPPEDKVAVLKLAAIMRVADSLDCSRGGRFNLARVAVHGHTLSLQTPDDGGGDFRLERFYLGLKGDLFGDVFGLDLKIEECAL